MRHLRLEKWKGNEDVVDVVDEVAEVVEAAEVAMLTVCLLWWLRLSLRNCQMIYMRHMYAKLTNLTEARLGHKREIRHAVQRARVAHTHTNTHTYIEAEAGTHSFAALGIHVQSPR